MNGPRALLAVLAVGLLGVLAVGITLVVRVRRDTVEAARAVVPLAGRAEANPRIENLEDRLEELEQEIVALRRDLAARREAAAAETGDGPESIEGLPAALAGGGRGAGGAEDLAALVAQTAGENGEAAAELREALADLFSLPGGGARVDGGEDLEDLAGTAEHMAGVADRAQEVLTLSPYQREVFLEANAKAHEIRRSAKELLLDPGASLEQKRNAARSLRQARYAVKRSFLKSLDDEQRRTLLQLEKEHLLPKGWLLPPGRGDRKGKKKTKHAGAS